MLRAVAVMLLLATPSTSLAAPPGPSRDALVQARFGPSARVTWQDGGAARRVSGLRVPTVGRDAGERARHFVREHAALLGLRDDVRVDEVRDVTAPDARVRFQFVRMAQLWKGLPIEGRATVIRMNAAGEVTSLASDGGALEVPEPAALIAPEVARETVRKTYTIVAASEPTLCVLPLANGGRVAWKLAVATLPVRAHFHVWVDAASGAILREAPAAFDQALRELPVAPAADDRGEVGP